MLEVIISIKVWLGCLAYFFDINFSREAFDFVQYIFFFKVFRLPIRSAGKIAVVGSISFSFCWKTSRNFSILFSPFVDVGRPSPGGIILFSWSFLSLWAIYPLVRDPLIYIRDMKFEVLGFTNICCQNFTHFPSEKESSSNIRLSLFFSTSMMLFSGDMSDGLFM